MIVRLKIIAVVLVAAASLFPTAAVMADYNPLCPTQDSNGICTSGACKGSAANSSICKQAAAQGTTNPVSGPNGIISKAANIIASVTAIGAIIMILIGGFFYVTSAGNSESAGKAKARIASGFIGLIIVALAWAFVRLISDKILK